MIVEKNNISPYKTYFKEVYSIKDSTITVENIKMDMWLTKFSVTIETVSWKNRRDDEDDGRREIANQRHEPFYVVLEILNVAPWYVNTGNAFDKKADVAIGAIYCEGITKKLKDNRVMGVEPNSVGQALPLITPDYYKSLENPDEIFDQKEENKTIWNKPLYAIISVPNIGSYRKLTSKGDEQVTFDFIMPVFVRGRWDIQIPSSIIPEYKPTPPYRRSLTNILIPKWGMGILGKVISILIYVLIIGVLALLLFNKFIPF